MGNSLTAKRYAKSLIASAIEKGSVDAVYADMNLVGGTLAENRDLQNTLTSPIIKPEKKLVILDLIFKGQVNEMTTSFMKLVSENNRVDILGEIAYAYDKANNLLNNYNDIRINKKKLREIQIKNVW